VDEGQRISDFAIGGCPDSVESTALSFVRGARSVSTANETTPTPVSRRLVLSAAAAASSLLSVASNSASQEAVQSLPSWNDGTAKKAILDFVQAVTDQSGKSFVAPENRIATFDQDGTLWVEHPNYTQAMFALDRVHAMASQHPEWKSREPFKAVLSNDMGAIGKFSEGEWAEIVFLTHSGMSQAEFQDIVREWLVTARHPRFKRRYTELTYKPMREVMDLLRANKFKTYIVTGGGQDFVRAYADKIYGVPPEQVIGSLLAVQFELKDGRPELMRLPKLLFNDNFAGKAIGIDLFIGKRPYASFGNSTGDQQMLEWTGAGDGPRLNMLVYHDDATREYAYGPGGGLPGTHVGTFSQPLLNEAHAKGWLVISMKNDWKRVFGFD
jgi:haloacid dehalogenase-like hydrolase